MSSLYPSPEGTIFEVSEPKNAENRVDETGLASVSPSEKGNSVEQTAEASKQGAPKRTTLQKALILSLLCSAQFFDIFASVAALAALPEIGATLHFTPGALQWVVSAYTLTFAAFMVSAGRLSDIYHPKPVFCLGYAIVGVFSVLGGVSVDPIMLLVFRAVQGIGAAMTLPSAVSMIVQEYTDPGEQSRALATFGAFGSVGNAIGFVIGGVLTARVSWRWVFYLIAIVVIPFSLMSFLLLPKHSLPTDTRRKIDYPGVLALTGGLILFVYAISDANDIGWGQPRIIITLVFSVVFMIAFFFIERFVKDPAIPPSIWTNENFLPLFFYLWSAYWWLVGIELQLIQVFQDLFHWSPLRAALHFLPIGIVGGITTYLSGYSSYVMSRRIQLLSGQLLMGGGAVLFALADRPTKYWSYMVPGFIIGVTGLAMGYVGANVAIMAGAKKGQEGVVGALINTAFQIGATIGVAITTSVTIGVNKKQPLDALSQHKGYEASFLSIVAMNGLILISTVLFVR